MSYIKKFAWSGSALAVAGLMAFALMIASSPSVAQAVAHSFDVDTNNCDGATISSTGHTSCDIDVNVVGATAAIGDSITLSTNLGVWYIETEAGNVTITGEGTGTITIESDDGLVAANTVRLMANGSGGAAGIAQVTISSDQAFEFIGAADDAEFTVTFAAAAAAGTSAATPRNIFIGLPPQNAAGSAGFVADTATGQITVTTDHGILHLVTSAEAPTTDGSPSGQGTQTLVITNPDAISVGPMDDANHGIRVRASSVGVATVTVTQAGISKTYTLDFRGAAANVSVITLQESIARVGTTGAINTSTTVRATVTDAAGNPVAGQEVTFAVTSPATNRVTLSATTVNTGSNGRAEVTATAGTTVALGEHTIRARIVVAGVNVDSTTGLVVAGPLADVTVDAEATVDPGSVSTVTATGVDAAGNIAWDGLPVSGAASAGALVQCGNLSGGTADCTFLAPGTAQTVTVSIVVGTGAAARTGTATIVVGDPVVEPEPGQFTPPIPAGGLQISQYTGSQAEFEAETGIVSCSITVAGAFVTYVYGAPAFVNAGFLASAEFDGSLLVVCRGS